MVRFQRLVILLLIVSVVVDPVFLPIAQAEEPTDIVDRPWPREIEENGVKLVIYQPQPEILEGNRLRARAAISRPRPERGSPDAEYVCPSTSGMSGTKPRAKPHATLRCVGAFVTIEA